MSSNTPLAPFMPSAFGDTGIAHHLPFGHGGCSFLDLCLGHKTEPFSLVYDCGAMSPNIMSQWLDLRVQWNRLLSCLCWRVRPWRKKPRIDLLVLSHFDLDHVNGLPALLERFEVQTVWLSQPNQVEDALLRWNAGLKGQPTWYAEFTKSPTEWLRRNGVLHVIRVSDGPSAAPDEPGEDPPLDPIPETRLSLPAGPNLRGADNHGEWVVSSSARIRLGEKAAQPTWELRPVVGPAKTPDPHFLEKLDDVMGKDWRSNPNRALARFGEKGRSDGRSRLRALYKKSFGNQNRSSLMLLVSRRAATTDTFSFICPKALRLLAYCDPRTAADPYVLNHGCVLTGDAKLKDAETRRQLLGALKAAPSIGFDTFVVPHHGSKDSFDAHSLNEFKPFAAPQAVWIVPDASLTRWNKWNKPTPSGQLELDVRSTGFREPATRSTKQ